MNQRNILNRLINYKDNMKKQEKIIFLGMLIILLGLIINAVGNILTFIAVIIGGYFVIKGIIDINKRKKKR